MAVFRGEVGIGELIASDEGELQFANPKEIQHLPLVEDIPILLPKVLAMKKDSQPLHAHYQYFDGELVIEFNQGFRS